MDTPHENGPSHREPAKGKSLGCVLGQWINDCFPVWADAPPYDRHHDGWTKRVAVSLERRNGG